MKTVSFRIERDGGVAAWSAERLRFEPSGWMKERYLPALRSALRALPAGEGVLVAELATASTDFFDVENVLLYNVGSGCLSHLTAGGLAFRRVRAVPTPDDLAASASATRASYCVGAVPSWLDEAPVAATFDLDAARMRVHSVWWATRVAARMPPLEGAFGLRLSVTPPSGRPTNPVGYCKVLLDGVIAALQVDTAPREVAVERLAALLDEPPGRVFERLAANAQVLRSEGRLVFPRGAGVQWSPADDRCEAVVLVVEEPEGSTWRARGTVHAIPADSGRAVSCAGSHLDGS